jgi:hypothetical protein
MAEELKAAYLLTGSDRPKIDRALRRLRDRYGDESLERLTADQVSGEDAVAACNAMGLFATGGRLVLVEGVERWKAPDAKAVAEYLAAPAPDTVLALVGEEIRKDSPLAKACAKAGAVLVYEVSKRELPKWVGDQFARHGVRVGPDASRALSSWSATTVRLAGEIDKLGSGQEPTRSARTRSSCRCRPGRCPAVALTDAWGGAVEECSPPASRFSSVRPLGRDPSASTGWSRRPPRPDVSASDAENHAREAAPQLRCPFAAEKAFRAAGTLHRQPARRSSGFPTSIRGPGREPLPQARAPAHAGHDPRAEKG